MAVMGVLRGFFQGMGTMMPTAISQIIEQIVNAIVSIAAASYLFSYGVKLDARQVLPMGRAEPSTARREVHWVPAWAQQQAFCS